jgi:hypothetical protein
LPNLVVVDTTLGHLHVVVEEAPGLLRRACRMATFMETNLGRPTVDFMAFPRSTGEEVEEVNKLDVGDVVMGPVEGVTADLVDFRRCQKA